MTTIRPLLLVDACVLIDYANSSSSVLKLVSKHVGKLHVATTVFREVTQVRPDDASRFGLTVVEPNLDMLAQAAAVKGRLSFEDRIALIMSKELGFTCVSNDTQLRLECNRQGVPVLWGLELLVQLADAGAINVAKAVTIGTAICNANKWLGPDVLARFLARMAGS